MQLPAVFLVTFVAVSFLYMTASSPVFAAEMLSVLLSFCWVWVFRTDFGSGWLWAVCLLGVLWYVRNLLYCCCFC